MFPAMDQRRGYVSRNGPAPVHFPEANSVTPFRGQPPWFVIKYSKILAS